MTGRSCGDLAGLSPDRPELAGSRTDRTPCDRRCVRPRAIQSIHSCAGRSSGSSRLWLPYRRSLVSFGRVASAVRRRTVFAGEGFGSCVDGRKARALARRPGAAARSGLPPPNAGLRQQGCKPASARRGPPRPVSFGHFTVIFELDCRVRGGLRTELRLIAGGPSKSGQAMLGTSTKCIVHELAATWSFVAQHERRIRKILAFGYARNDMPAIGASATLPRPLVAGFSTAAPFEPGSRRRPRAIPLPRP